MPKGVERPDPHAGRTVDRLQPQSNRRSQNHTIRAHYQSRLRRLSCVAQNSCPLSRYLRDPAIAFIRLFGIAPMSPAIDLVSFVLERSRRTITCEVTPRALKMPLP